MFSLYTRRYGPFIDTGVEEQAGVYAIVAALMQKLKCNPSFKCTVALTAYLYHLEKHDTDNPQIIYMALEDSTLLLLSISRYSFPIILLTLTLRLSLFRHFWPKFQQISIKCVAGALLKTQSVSNIVSYFSKLTALSPQATKQESSFHSFSFGLAGSDTITRLKTQNLYHL